MSKINQLSVTAISWYSFFLLLLTSSPLFAQDGILIDYASSPPARDNSAVFEVRSSDQGILVPQVALTQTSSASPISTPATSLMVYNTATLNDVTPGYYFWDGSAWQRLFSGNNNITGSGTATEVAFWNNSNTLSSSSNLYWDSGNNRLGIGTSSPDRDITVAGSGGTYVNVKNTSANIETLLGSDGSRGILSVMTNHDLQLRAGGNNTYMTVKSDGDVGVGTTDPDGRFHVSGGDAVIDNARKFYFQDNSGNNDSYIWRAGGNALRVAYVDNVMVFDALDDQPIHIRNSSDNTQIQLHPAGESYFTSGNVGIGTTSPSYDLDVSGNTRTTGDFYGDIHVDDTRSVNDPPSTFDKEVAFDFKFRSTVGVPGSGTYSGMMTIAPWGDNSGDASHQINFNEGGLYWRQGQPDAGSWGSWNEILTTANGISGGSGSTNYLARWTSNTTLGTGVTYDDGTHVGIGNTSPSAKLDISSAESIGLEIASSYGSNHWLLRGNTNGSNWSGFWETSDDIRLLLRDNSGNIDVDLRPDGTSYINAGNVGIGTTSPSDKLHVYGTDSKLIVEDGGSNQSYLELNAGNAGSPQIGMSDKNNDMFWAIGGDDQTNDFKIAGTTSGAIPTINANNSSEVKVTIETGGNVGIGTTSPGQRLDVNGNIHLGSSTGNKQIYTWTATDDNWRIGMSASPGFNRSLNTSHVQYMTYAGGTTQGFAVGVNGGNSGFEVRGSDHRAFFRGDVGVGTTSPSANLHVYAPDSEVAQVMATGGSQGTGVFYAGQSTSYGGGMSYDGDGTPGWIGGTDRITFFRRQAGTDYDVMSYSYNNSTVRINNLSSGVVISNASGDLSSTTDLSGTGWGDNLGNHNATTNLDMNNNPITEVDQINFASGEAIYDGTNLQINSNSGYIDFRPSDNTHGLIIRDFDGSSTTWSGIRTQDDGSMELRADGADYSQLVLSDNDRIGMGTSSPSEKLDVRGNVYIDPQQNSQPALEISGSDGGYDGLLIDMDDDQGGNNFYALKIRTDDGSSHQDSDTKFVVEAGGNVGINTISPSQRLDVNGNVRIRGGSPNPGDVLTATSTNGTATWSSNTDRIDYYQHTWDDYFTGWEIAGSSGVTVSVESGERVLLLCAAEVDHDDEERIWARFRRGGTWLHETVTYEEDDQGGTWNDRFMVNMQYVDNPGAGTHTYYFYIRGDDYSGAYVRNNSFVAITF